MKFSFKLLYLLVFAFGSSHLKAVSYAGSEIVYKYIGNSRYVVSLTIYKYCEGDSFGTTAKVKVEYDLSSTCTGEVDLTFPLVSVTNVSKHIKSDSLCRNSNAANSAKYGFEALLYQDTVDFTQTNLKSFYDASCSGIYFSHAGTGRSDSITTITVNNTPYYIYAYLNLDFKENSSPVIKTSPLFLAGCNAEFQLAYGGVDYKDYDSLSYHLVAPHTSKTGKVVYKGAFTERYPFTPYCIGGGITCTPIPPAKPYIGIYSDSDYPLINSTPTNCGEVAVVCMETYEYRKDSMGIMRKIGSVRRETDLTVIGTINNTPKVLGPYDHKLTDLACKDSIVINIKTRDDVVVLPPPATQFAPDTTHFIQPYLPKNMDFKIIPQIRETIGDLIIRYDEDIQPQYPYYVIVEVEDKHSPLSAYAFGAYRINPKPNYPFAKLIGKVYLDNNKNCAIDSGESGVKRILLINGVNQNNYPVNADGTFGFCFPVDTQYISLMPHPFFDDSCGIVDTTLVAEPIKKYYVDFLTRYKDGIGGSIFNDKNQNCVWDKNESKRRSQDASITVNPGDKTYFANADGVYFIPLTKKDTYTLTVKALFELSHNSNCNDTLLVYYPGDTTIQNINFALKPLSELLTINVRQDRPFTRPTTINNYQTVIDNKSATDTLVNVHATFTINQDVSKDSFLLKKGVSKVNNGYYTILIDTLFPNSKYTNTYTFVADTPAFNSNSVLHYSFSLDSFIKSNFSTYSKLNLTFERNVNLRGPKDPNYKLSQQPTLTKYKNNIAEYYIQFQNLGTDTAFYVELRDTLAKDVFDLSQFKLTGASHPAHFLLQDHELRIIFEGIYLTDSATNAEQSVGWATFSLPIKQLSDSNYLIPNRAGIYFDFEEPVITNYDTIQYVSPIITHNLNKLELCEHDSFIIAYQLNYPNTGAWFQLQAIDSQKAITVIDSMFMEGKNGEFYTIMPSSVLQGNYIFEVIQMMDSIYGFKNSKSNSLYYRKTPPISIFSVQDRICFNSEFLVSISPNLGANQWYNNGVLIKTDTASSVIIPNISNEINTIYATTMSNGICASKSNVLEITGIKTPIASVTKSNETICYFSEGIDIRSSIDWQGTSPKQEIFSIDNVNYSLPLNNFNNKKLGQHQLQLIAINSFNCEDTFLGTFTLSHQVQLVDSITNVCENDLAFLSIDTIKSSANNFDLELDIDGKKETLTWNKIINYPISQTVGVHNYAIKVADTAICSNPIVGTFQVYAKPQASFLIQRTFKDSVVIVNTSNTGKNGVYILNTRDTFVAKNTIQTLPLVYIGTHHLELRLKDSNGCANSYSLNFSNDPSSIYTLSRNSELEIPSFLKQGATILIKGVEKVKFTELLIYDLNGRLYQKINSFPTNLDHTIPIGLCLYSFQWIENSGAVHYATGKIEIK